ncbi:MAG: tetratricopeptide repeat protein [Methylococcales bacterium]
MSSNSEEFSKPETTIELEDATEKSPKETANDKLMIWIERFRLCKEILIDFVIVCVLGSIIFIFCNEWQREAVIIEPLAVPDSFVQQGYTGAVLVGRLMDQVSANREAAYNLLPDNQKYLFPVEVTDSDLTNTLNVDIPETGLSINTLIQYIRQLRGLETRISGDLVGDANNFELTIRINGETKVVKGNIGSLDESLVVAAEHIVENTQPYFLALHYYGKKDYDKAFDLVQITLKNKDTRDDAFAFDLWGNILARKKQYENAIEKYNESIKINPDNSSPYIGLGYAYYQGYKNYDAAISNYQKVIDRDDTNYLAYNDLALVLADKGDTNAAIESYKKAIVANPNYANAYYNLGLIFLGKKDYQQAIIQFNKIIELPYNEGNFKAYNGLCYSLGQESKYQEAINNCELAIKIKPKDDNIYDTLGSVYFMQKDYSKALLNYQTAVDYNAENSEAQQHLAEVLAILRRCEEANTHLELALQLDNTINKKGVQKYCESSAVKNQ